MLGVFSIKPFKACNGLGPGDTNYSCETAPVLTLKKTYEFGSSVRCLMPGACCTVSSICESDRSDGGWDLREVVLRGSPFIRLRGKFILASE